MATSTELLDCEMCGRETPRLFDGGHCAVCRLGYLAGSHDGLCYAHRMLAAMVVDAVVHEGLDPADVRDTVEGALKYAETNRGTGHGPLSNVKRDLDAHQALKRSEVA